MSTPLIDERQLLSGLRRAQVEAADLRGTVEALRRRLADAERKLRERPTLQQARAMVDENAELRRMNAILLQRNEVLARRRRQPVKV